MRSSRFSSIDTLHRDLLSWYGTHRRALTWREMKKPYEILISEVMLQQTQVARVQEKLPQFLEAFPSFSSLARARTSDVVRAWHGMGYNSRAVRLRELARVVERDFDGKLPTAIEQLQSLPGIGPYTAHAVSCFAMKKRVPLVDVNIRRVLSRLFWKMNSLSALRTEKEIWDIAKRILPKSAYTWNQALMDLGAAICVSRRPLCPSCPVAALCASRNLSRLNGGTSETTTRRPEPMYDGIPQRIWRGKIVHSLRSLDGLRSMSIDTLGKSIRGKFSRSEIPWLLSVIDRLQRDGLVAVRRTPRTTYISLAHE